MTYWIAANRVGGHKRRLHADRDCPRLSPARNVYRAAAEQEEWYDVCGFCDPETDVYGERAAPDFSYQRALKEAADE